MAESLYQRHNPLKSRRKAPKSTKIPLSISEASLQASNNQLESLLGALERSDPKSFERVEILIGRLNQADVLPLLNTEILSNLISKLKEMLTESIDYKQPSSQLPKLIQAYLDPVRLYLSIISCDRLDPQLYIDEILENILELVKRACSIVSKKPTENKKLMSGLCNVLCSLVPLVRRCFIPDYWIVSLTDYLLNVLFANANMVQLSCCLLYTSDAADE